MKYKIGVICGAFDLIHPGYIAMFRQASSICKKLTVFLQVDPSEERPGKLKPIFSPNERREILLSLSYVSAVVFYTTEDNLERELKSYPHDVRILGSDYVGRHITGSKRIDRYYVTRPEDGWSTTKLVELIVKRGLPNGESKDIQTN